ncbi:MAG: hypothetical protein A3J63_04585 [Candidatus Moranbacteria bacterium RIFCSPHIGHO2_02_FULL_40_12b]|nr:MAG: hypothetical protein A3J63_04585 [Candidatus Moranbacteria bacterium RIFCSPHIGHO2_02_FULL_40_12b]
MIKFFPNFPEIFAVMSLRGDGNMKINYCGRKKRSTNGNRRNFFKRNGISEDTVISALLDHGNKAVVISGNSSRYIEKADALLTGDCGIYLSITVADCYPIMFYDPVAREIALAHAGWQGAVSGVVSSTMIKMILRGCDPRNIRAEVGPGICQKHLEFSRSDLLKLKQYNNPQYYSDLSQEKVLVDLKKIIGDQLAAHGISGKNIAFSRECTFCHPEKYFSYRRDGKNSEGQVNAMVVISGMKENKVKEKGRLILAEKECLSFA